VWPGEIVLTCANQPVRFSGPHFITTTTTVRNNKAFKCYRIIVSFKIFFTATTTEKLKIKLGGV